MDITATDVMNAIENKEACILLDVRTPMEFARGKIEGAINIPFDEITPMIKRTIPDTSTKIYVYCLSASRSPFAVETLEDLGYTNVFNMEHGLMAWRYFKYPMV